jgi:hypothetical protein
VVFDRRGSNPLGVVPGYWRNRKRASLARTRYWDRNPDTPNFCSHGLVGYDARLTRERSRVQVSVRIYLFLLLNKFGKKKPSVVMGGLRDRRLVPISLVGQDTRFSPWRPGFESRMGNFLFFLLSHKSLGQPPREKQKTNKSYDSKSQVCTIGTLACPSG